MDKMKKFCNDRLCKMGRKKKFEGVKSTMDYVVPQKIRGGMELVVCIWACTMQL